MKVVLDPYVLLASQSLSATTTSEEIESIAYFGAAVQVNVSAASGLSSNLTLEASNDKINWCTVEDSSHAVTTSTPHMWQMWEVVPFKWLRVKITISAGSATFEVIMTGMRA
jgi:hypothetical protein